MGIFKIHRSVYSNRYPHHTEKQVYIRLSSLYRKCVSTHIQYPEKHVYINIVICSVITLKGCTYNFRIGGFSIEIVISHRYKVWCLLWTRYFIRQEEHVFRSGKIRYRGTSTSGMDRISGYGWTRHVISDFLNLAQAGSGLPPHVEVNSTHSCIFNSIRRGYLSHARVN